MRIKKRPESELAKKKHIRDFKINKRVSRVWLQRIT